MTISKLIRVLLHLLAVVVLTVLTQVGGVAYILALLSRRRLTGMVKAAWQSKLVLLLLFVAYYMVISFVIVPPLAKMSGRVALPCDRSADAELRPATWYTCACNRNYVVPILRDMLLEVSGDINEKYPGTSIGYLDANFPFMDGFPLIPHLSHNDGRKVDLAFLYLDKATNEATHKVPSIIGYGVHEPALPNEANTAAFCAENGYWNYDLIRHIVPQGDKEKYQFDRVRTKWLLIKLLTHPNTGKVFLEPHLRDRFRLGEYPKMRFHGCHAVRHDDHIHLQL